MTKIYPSTKIVFLIVYFSGLTCTPALSQSTETIDRLRNKAEMLYAQGDYKQALTNYLDGYRLARQLDPVRAANLTVDISSIYHMQGDYRRGAVLCQEGVMLLKGATTQPDSVWFKLTSSLGEMYKKLNSQDSCYLYFSRANTLLQKHPELENRIPAYVIYHYNNQGMMYVRDGGYTEGLSYLTKALSIAEKHTASKEDIAILQNNLGELYERLGNMNKAIALRKSALRNYTKNDFYKCKIYNGLSKDALHDGLYEETALYAEETIMLAKSITQSTPAQSTKRSLIIALTCLGECAYLTGKYYEAETYFNAAIKHHKRYYGDQGDIIPLSYLGLATIQRGQNQLDNALLYCQQAIIASHLNFTSTNVSSNPTPEQALSEQSLFKALVLKAELLSQCYSKGKKITDLRNAHSAYVHALAVADVMRKRYSALETKWFFATQVRPAYLSAVETAYTLHTQTQKNPDREQAFSLLEQSKAVAFADITREWLIKPANVPAALLTQERELQRTITKLKLDATSAPSPKLTDAQIQLAQLQQRFENEFPAYYRAKYQPQPVQASQVRAVLDNRTTYLSYLLIHNALYIAVVTPAGLTIVRKSGDLNELKTALKTLDTALYTNPGLGNYTGTPAAIMGYRWLVEPVAHLLKNTERLVISRDGDLHRLPFEVLETGRVVDDFLIKQYAISYVPSASALLQPAKPTAAKPKNSLLGLAPFVEPADPKTASPALPYLPASRAEVEQLPGEVLLGKAATKPRFMRTYARYDMLHFATHAYADNAEPARSYIAFYPDENPDKLYAGEIYTLSLPHTRLVMLSACETGNGKLQPGEGVMSLAQAFGYAGCPSVISTLWSANDESTAYLARQTYTHLQAGLPIDVALQRTRLDYFRSNLYPKLNHPHYWANLVLIGTNRPLYDAPWPFTGVVSAVIALMLCLSSVLVIRQRRLAQRALV